MLENDEDFFDHLKGALEVKGKSLSVSAFKLWCRILEPYHVDDIKKAIDQAMMSPSFLLEPSKILEFLPDLLGHPTPEIAWGLYPKSDSDAGYVTDEIMLAGSAVADPLDKMARMPFLEAYKQIMSNAKMNQTKAKWWYSQSSTGTSEQRKELKIQHAIEAMQCGRLTEQKAKNTVMQLSQELGKQSSAYLPSLPAPAPMKLADQRQQIGIVSKKICKALELNTETSSLTTEEAEKQRFERVKKIQADLDKYAEIDRQREG